MLSLRFLRRPSILLPPPLLQIPLLPNIINRSDLPLPLVRFRSLVRILHPLLPLVVIVPQSVCLLRRLHALMSISLSSSQSRPRLSIP